MKKIFLCSLCHNGILGGGLYLDRHCVTYVCQKLTVVKKYKKIVLPLKDIEDVCWKWVVFPVAVFRMQDGAEYKFLIFHKRRFQKWFEEYRRSV